ncbi:MAG: DNA polymerase II [Nanoarchaeota archaeon]
MKGFIIYPTYRIIEGKAYINLYGKLENGQSFLTINTFKPYFFIKSKDLKKAQNLEKFDFENTKFTNFNKESVTKIILNIPSDVPQIRELFEDNNIECYEADIRFAYRFLIDKKIQGSIEIEGEYETGERVDRIFKEPNLKPTDYKPNNLKVLSLDIETSIDGKKLYSLSLYSDKYQKSFIVSKNRIPDAISCYDEVTLLENFHKVLTLEDPDIITGWNVIDFDLNFLNNKFKQHKIPFNLGRDNSNSKLKLQQNFFRDSKADLIGRQVLDGLSLLKSSFVKVPDYKLETVAKDILGKKKLIEDKSKIDEIYKKDPKKLVDYNLNDAKLVFDIINKSGTLELSIQRSLLTGMQLDRVSASIASFDSIYLKKARDRNLVAPTGKFSDKPSSITGGYVMESKPGIYDNVLVFDFRSLYPSVMRTFNIDPASFLGKKKEKNSIQAPNKVFFRNENGIVPEIIQTLWEERERARKEKNELARYAIKILMNSFFGIMASPSCRFFSMDFANAITHFGQYFVKLTAEKINKMGLEVIYADTDSNFVNANTESEKKANEIGEKIEKDINIFYRHFIKKGYNRESFLELEFEKNYLRFLMPKIRSGKKGAKKRYAGLLIKDGKEKLETIGIESVRSDWTGAAQEFQKGILDRIFHKKEISSYIKKFIHDIRKGEYDNKLIYRKQIRKELEKYVKTTPPHVKAARQLDKLDSNIIEYYITTDGPEPKQKLKHKLDYDHYINKQIKPIAEMVLVFFKLNFDDILKGSKQTKLFNY